MARSNKANTTILLPCYNEAYIIEASIKHYKTIGFKNVLVIDDGSKDETNQAAKAAHATVIRNNGSNGFLLTTLRGIYSVKNGAALVIDPDKRPSAEDLEEFLDFAFAGNYGLLFSRGRAKYMPNITKYLKKRFGIFLSSPNFEVTFIGKNIIETTKTAYTMTDQYLYFNLIAHAIETRQKIGTYNLRLPSSPGISLPASIGRRSFRAENKYSEFFDYAFPDLKKQKISSDIKVAIIAALAGSFLTVITQLILKQFGV